MDLLRLPLDKLGLGPISRSVEIADPSAQFGGVPSGVGPVTVDLELRGDAGDAVRAQGVVRTWIEVPCRRCLAAEKRSLEFEFEFWYRPPSGASSDEEAVWPLARKASEVDLTEALREELWIACPEFLECDPICGGLCPQCGARLPEEPCTCPPPAPDPRWGALSGIEAD